MARCWLPKPGNWDLGSTGCLLISLWAPRKKGKMRGPPEVSVLPPPPRPRGCLARVGPELRGSDRAQHRGWYTFAVNTAAGGVYTFGADAKEVGANGSRAATWCVSCFWSFGTPCFWLFGGFQGTPKQKPVFLQLVPRLFNDIKRTTRGLFGVGTRYLEVFKEQMDNQGSFLGVGRLSKGSFSASLDTKTLWGVALFAGTPKRGWM